MLITATRTLKGALEDKALRFPDETFLIFEDAAGATARWTWHELDADANRAAHLLLERGLAPGDKFNLHLGNCPEFLLFWMAAAKTGTVMVPTNPVSTA
ncbi:MAG TPA: AMP-binding protein, partial [Methylomirabilota bacterium]